MKATNVTKQAKRPGEAHPTTTQMVAFCVAAFADATSASATLENAKALWDAARMGLRTELARAQRIIGNGRPWDAFKASVRAALVKARVVATPKEAGRLVDNQLIALGLTGKGTRKGGKRKGAGRKEKTDTGVATTVSDKAQASRIMAALAYIARCQEDYKSEVVMLECMGDIARLLNGETLK